jgi:hypothetical protein
VLGKRVSLLGGQLARNERSYVIVGQTSGYTTVGQATDGKLRRG